MAVLKTPLIQTSLLLFMLVCTPLVADDETDAVPVEELRAIEHLQAAVADSGCEFQRNGRWYEPEKALSHMNRKYEYVLKRGGIKTADDFIRYAATESSMSGKLYMVQCPEEEIQPTGEWLQMALATYRSESDTGPKTSTKIDCVTDPEFQQK